MLNKLRNLTKDPQPERVLRPPVDISETQTEVVLEVDMPGVTKDSVSVEVDRNTLVISGKKQKDAAEEKFTALYRERYPEAEYRREFELNSELDRDRISASLNAGVLRVTLGKSQETQPRKIEIVP
jgi:HSP20 family molecular chaperone IbpA